MLPIGSTTTGPPFEGCTSVILVLHASMAWPFTRMAQEPQIALRQEHRSASDPSISSRILMSPSRTVAFSSISKP